MEEIAMQTLAEGFDFVEDPRWHEGRLWFVDFFQEKVMTLDEQGHREDVVHVPGRPSGMGWLPDGSLLVVSMTHHQVMRYRDGRLTVHADLNQLVSDYDLNDMLVDEQGRAYVGNFGCKLFEGGEPKPTCLVMVDPAGKPQVVAEDLIFPNGMVLVDEGTLVVAESFAMRLTAFDRRRDGTLTNRRVWASLGGLYPEWHCPGCQRWHLGKRLRAGSVHPGGGRRRHHSPGAGGPQPGGGLRFGWCRRQDALWLCLRWRAARGGTGQGTFTYRFSRCADRCCLIRLLGRKNLNART